MNKSLITQFISDSRFTSYADMAEYEHNLVFSKQSYIPLAILEVALRNSIDKLLSEKVAVNWYEHNDFLTRDSQHKIAQAVDLLERRRERVSKDKIIAELSFGFWVNLFKKPYDKKLRINDLKKIFPNLPSRQEKRTNREIVYRELNHVRNFRNRVFHHEKVLNKDNYNVIFDEINEVLSYFDNEVCEFSKRVNHE